MDTEIPDRVAVIDVSLRFALAMDTCNWILLRECFADTVYADLSEATGQPAAEVTGDMFVQAMRNLLDRPGLKTQHQLTNHRVTLQGDTAECITYYVARHFLPQQDGGREFVAYGWYTDHFTRQDEEWRIDRRKITVRWITGDPTILGIGV